MLFIPFVKDRFCLLVKAAEDLGAFECVFWPIGDSGLPELPGLQDNFLRKDVKERVTTYDDEKVGQVSVYGTTATQVISSFDGWFGEVEKSLDSIAFYRPGEMSWTLCYIFHEHMAIAKHDEAASVLEAHELSPSQVPPDYW